MKKIIVVSMMAAVLILSACGPSVVSPSPSATISASSSPTTAPSPSLSPSPAVLKVRDYFPFTPDVTMTYAGEGNEYAGFVSHVDYINNGAIQLRTNNGGTELVSVYAVEDGALIGVFSQEETYYRYDFTAERTKNEILIMEPITIGTAWTLEDGGKRSITATDAAITVPYGSFKALEVTTENEYGIVKSYYVADMGFVKSEYASKETPSALITSALEKVEKGSPFTQSVRFYFPDFNDKISYVDISLAFKTGDNPAPKFEYEFKNIPADSGLARVMKEGSSIRSITFDRNTNVVTVDFTKEFITEMNAGTSYEGRILESVADTLGGYFQTDKVQITIEGGPYESGHFLFNLGDYLPYDPDSAYARP